MNFEEIFRGLGFNPFNPGCSDIPGGFQDINPQLFLVLGEVLGNVIAGNLPINVANSLGNWLELLGQVLLVYSAQQQYFQNGPGRTYNYIYKNVGNPFCTNNVPNNSESSGNGIDNLMGVNLYNKRSSSGSRGNSSNYDNKSRNNKSKSSNNTELYQLQNQIEKINQELIRLRNEINSFKGR